MISSTKRSTSTHPSASAPAVGESTRQPSRSRFATGSRSSAPRFQPPTEKQTIFLPLESLCEQLFTEDHNSRVHRNISMLIHGLNTAEIDIHARSTLMKMARQVLELSDYRLASGWVSAHFLEARDAVANDFAGILQTTLSSSRTDSKSLPKRVSGLAGKVSRIDLPGSPNVTRLVESHKHAENFGLLFASTGQLDAFYLKQPEGEDTLATMAIRVRALAAFSYFSSLPFLLVTASGKCEAIEGFIPFQELASTFKAIQTNLYQITHPQKNAAGAGAGTATRRFPASNAAEFQRAIAELGLPEFVHESVVAIASSLERVFKLEMPQAIELAKIIHPSMRKAAQLNTEQRMYAQMEAWDMGSGWALALTGQNLDTVKLTWTYPEEGMTVHQMTSLTGSATKRVNDSGFNLHPTAPSENRIQLVMPRSAFAEFGNQFKKGYQTVSQMLGLDTDIPEVMKLAKCGSDWSYRYDQSARHPLTLVAPEDFSQHARLSKLLKQLKKPSTTTADGRVEIPGFTLKSWAGVADKVRSATGAGGSLIGGSVASGWTVGTARTADSGGTYRSLASRFAAPKPRMIEATTMASPGTPEGQPLGSVPARMRPVVKSTGSSGSFMSRLAGASVTARKPTAATPPQPPASKQVASRESASSNRSGTEGRKPKTSARSMFSKV